ncbi:hypothetical protein [Limimaricola cinnabarinus]|nr:hypothetical protein [Limimaricola cinnabarinus]
MVDDRCYKAAGSLTDQQLLEAGMSAHDIIALPELGTKERADAVIAIAKSGAAPDLSWYFSKWLRVPADDKDCP